MSKILHLGQIASIKTGPFGSQLHQEDYVEIGMPIVTVEHLGQKTFGKNNLPKVSEADYNRLAHYRLTTGDVVFSRVGSVDRCSYVSEKEAGWLFSGRCLRIRPNTRVVMPEYLYYYLNTQKSQKFIRSIAVGATMPSINTQIMAEVPILLPDNKTQSAIAKVLGSLDDKIAVNNRIIETADCLVDALYHQVKKLPPNSTFGEEFEIYGGATPSTKNDEFWGGDIFWATPTDITALNGPWLLNTSRTITHSGLKATSSILHPENAILMTSRATIGKTALASTPITTNQGFIVIHAPKDLVPWLFSQLRNRTHEFESWANGATFLELPRGVFKTLPFIRCDKDQLAKFNTTAWPLLKHIEAAQQENQTLARTRDELLPLLMSGKITVRDAEEASAEVGVDKHEVKE